MFLRPLISDLVPPDFLDIEIRYRLFLGSFVKFVFTLLQSDQNRYYTSYLDSSPLNFWIYHSSESRLKFG